MTAGDKLMRNKSLIAIAGLTLACALLLARHHALAQRMPALTAMDYIEIQQLVNRFNFALDYCTDHGNDLANLFIDAGQYVIDQGDGNPTVIDTRERLIALAGGPDCESRRTPPSAWILHVAESLIIAPADDGARGLSYAIYPSNKGNYFSDDVAGQLGFYHDHYVRTAAGWRFRTRRHETSPVVGEIELL
jgi:hypothetical protein